VKQHQTDGLAKWIDKVPTARERAAIDLGVASALSGRRNHDLERAMWSRSVDP
jgi:hypothetical protein